MSRESDLSHYYEQYKDRVNMSLLSVLNSPEDREDVVQEAFLKAFNAWGRFTGNNFYGWILRIAKNTAYDQLRHTKVMKQNPLNEDIEIESPEATPEQVILQQELVGDVNLAIEQLPARTKLITLYHYKEDMKIGEISEVLGVTRAVVRNNTHRGRVALKGTLEADYGHK